MPSTEKIDRETIWKRIEEIRGNDSNPEQLKLLLEAWDNDFGPEYDDLYNAINTKNSGALQGQGIEVYSNPRQIWLGIKLLY